MIDLFEKPIKSKRVRGNIVAYQYKNGTINIGVHKYLMYSMTDAIKKFREDFPSRVVKK